MKKTLNYNYDNINDTFVGKIDGKVGFSRDFSISDGVFIGINKMNLPTSIFIYEASEVFDITKHLLEISDFKILIDCDEFYLYFTVCIDDLEIYSVRCVNKFEIPHLNFLIDSNY